MNQENEVANYMPEADLGVSDNSTAIPDSAYIHQKETPKVSERPHYWPENLWDSEKGSPKLEDTWKSLNEKEKTLAEQNKRIEGFRKTIADKEVKAPEKYFFETDEEYGKLAAEDKEALDMFGKIFKEANLNDQQAQIVIDKYHENVTNLMNSRNAKSESEFGEEGKQIVEHLDATIQNLQNRRVLSNEETEGLKKLTKIDPNATKALVKILQRTGEKVIPSALRAQSMQQTADDIAYAMQKVLKDGSLNSKERDHKMSILRSKLQQVTQ